MKRLAYLASLSVMVLLLFAAVAVAQSTSDQGGSDPSSSDQTQSSDSSQQTDPNQSKIAWIHIHNQGFDPAQLNVVPGTEVAWVNDDTQPHSITSDDGKLFDSGSIDPGKTYGVILDGSGTVTYHGDSNPDMAGSIVVGGASSGEQTTPASDTTTPASGSTTSTGDTTQPTEETQTSGS